MAVYKCRPLTFNLFGAGIGLSKPNLIELCDLYVTSRVNTSVDLMFASAIETDRQTDGIITTIDDQLKRVPEKSMTF